jgi:hypothetical protein
VTHAEMMAFGERWRYPFLNLEDGTSQPHGRVYYDQLAYREARADLVEKRIEQWNALITRSQVTSAIDRVDRLKSIMEKLRSETIEAPANGAYEEIVKK